MKTRFTYEIRHSKNCKMVTVKEPFVIDVPNKSSFYETRETADKRVDGIWRTSGIVPIMRLLDHVEIVEVEDLPF